MLPGRRAAGPPGALSKPWLFVKHGKTLPDCCRSQQGPWGRLSGLEVEPDKEIQDLPGASTQGAKTSRSWAPGFTIQKGPKDVRGGRAIIEDTGEGGFTFGGLKVNPNEQKGLLEPWSLQ